MESILQIFSQEKVSWDTWDAIWLVAAVTFALGHRVDPKAGVDGYVYGLVNALHLHLVWIEKDEHLVAGWVSNHTNGNDKWRFTFDLDELVRVLLVGIDLFNKSHLNLSSVIVQGGNGLGQLQILECSSQAESNIVKLLHWKLIKHE